MINSLFNVTVYLGIGCLLAGVLSTRKGHRMRDSHYLFTILLWPVLFYVVLLMGVVEFGKWLATPSTP